MTRILFAAAAAFALASAVPAYAGCANCADCPGHEDKVAAADKAEKKDVVACPCSGAGKECKCGAKCECAHCTAKKAEKEAQKKT
jgi:hypothetical protein